MRNCYIIAFTDEFRMVKDGLYGNENPKIAGGWDGIVGELVRQVSEFCNHFNIIEQLYFISSRSDLTCQIKHSFIHCQTEVEL